MTRFISRRSHFLALIFFHATGVSLVLGVDGSAAQVPGTVDQSFAFGRANRRIEAMAVQTDGKLVIGGEFTNIRFSDQPYIARHLPDGNIDTSFDPGAGPDGPVRCVVLQDDGKILIGGSFTKVDGYASPVVARLNSDGSVDTQFRFAGNLPQIVRAIALQSDGKILAVGTEIARYDDRGRIDPSFSPISVQGPAFELSGAYAVAIQADGKILVGGEFFGNRALGDWSLARLLPDGRLDPGFSAGTDSPITHIRAIAVQRDGRILIGGDFVTVQRRIRVGIARLNADGELDLTFEPMQPPPNLPLDPQVSAVVLQEDGRILLAGRWGSSAYTGTPTPAYINRLRQDGSLDPSFKAQVTSSSGYGPIFALALDRTNRFYAGGNGVQGVDHGRVIRVFLDASSAQPVIETDPKPQLATLGGSARFHVLASGGPPLGYQWRLNGQEIRGAGDWQLNLTNLLSSQAGEYSVIVSNPSGSVTSAPARLNLRVVPAGWLDPSFNGDSGANGSVLALSLDAEGKIYVGGAFSRFNDRLAGGIVRLEPDGSTDPRFNPGTGTLGALGSEAFIKALARQSDGKILAGGKFRLFNGVVRNGLVRLEPGGRIDDSFQPPPNETLINSMALQSDGKVIVGGEFAWTTEPFSYRNMVRLNADGTLDRSLNAYFNTSIGRQGSARSSGQILAVVLQPDGNILAAGNYDVSNFRVMGLVRYFADGRMDTNFAPDLHWYSSLAESLIGIPDVRTVAIQPDGKIAAAGSFDYAGVTRIGPLTRLNLDGTVDRQFTPATSLLTSVGAILSQGDGRLLVAGTFIGARGVSWPNLIRLEASGLPDLTFDAGSGFDSDINAIAVDPNGDILVGGSFFRVNGIPRHGIARLFGTAEKTTRLLEPVRAGSQFKVRVLTQPGKSHVLEYNDSLEDANWNASSRVSGDGSVKELIDAAASPMRRFFRIRSD